MVRTLSPLKVNESLKTLEVLGITKSSIEIALDLQHITVLVETLSQSVQINH